MRKRAWPLGPKDKEKIYVAVCVIALLCAAVLLIVTFVNAGKTYEQKSVSPSVSSSVESPGAAAKKDSAAGKPSVVTLTGDEVSAILSAALPEDFPVESLVISLSGTQASASGKAERDGLISYLEKSGDEIPPLIRAALGILPEQTDIGFVFELPKYSGSAAHIELISMSVGGINLDAGIAPEGLTEALDKGLNDALSSYGKTIDSVYIENGKLVIKLR